MAIIRADFTNLPPLRIAVNTRFLLKDKLEGIGTFQHETLQRLVCNHPEHEFIFIFDRRFSDEYIYAPNVKPVVAFPQARHPYLYYVYFQYSIPRLLKKHKADLFFSPDGYLSLRTNVPQVQVLHDLAFEHYPEDISKSGAWYYTKFFPQFAMRAKRIITISEYTKKDIVELYSIPSEKIDLVYPGAAPSFKPVSEEIKQFTRRRFTKDHAYFLYVGAIQPRKNIGNLLKAFDAFRKSYGSGIKLVIVGRKAWKTQELEAIFEEMKFKEDVVFTGRLSNEDLGNVMGSALALTYVSYFEGFGIPILEAMHAGIPVICSGVTSMPEVAGDAALLVNPFSVESIKDAMIQMARDEKLRAGLISKGAVQKTKFSWEKTATGVWDSIERELPKK